MPPAYAAAREALFDELRLIVPKVLDFGDGEELVPGLFGDWALAIRTETTPMGGIPFLSLPEKDYRRKGPGSAVEQLHRMLRLLVRDRLWRERGGPAPHAALFKTNRLTDMLLHAHKTTEQEFIDAVWDPVDMHDGWSEAHEWQSHLAMPEVMKQSPASQRGERHTPATLPWISGVSLHDEVFIDAIALCPSGALYRLTRFGPTELRLPSDCSSFNTPGEGEPVGNIEWEGARLRNFDAILVDDLRYAGSFSTFKRSLRLMTEGEYLWEPTYFGGRAHDEVRADYNRRIRHLFLKRARIEATIVKHLQPFAGPENSRQSEKGD